MKYLWFTMCAWIAAFATLEAKKPGDIEIYSDKVYTVSSFNRIDYFCVYHGSGELAWEIPFNSKVLSWHLCDGSAFLFSQERQGKVYFLTCLNADTGELRWEKGIFAPDTFNRNEAETIPNMFENLDFRPSQSLGVGTITTSPYF